MFRLKELRERSHMTQDELGHKFGLSGSTISLYERGQRQPDYATLINFADYFGVSIDYLLGHKFDFLDYQQQQNLQEIQNIKREMAEARIAGNEEELALLAAQLEAMQESYEGIQFGVAMSQTEKETPVPMSERQAYWAERLSALSPPDQVLVASVLDGFRDNPEAMRAALGLALRAAMPSVPVP